MASPKEARTSAREYKFLSPDLLADVDIRGAPISCDKWRAILLPGTRIATDPLLITAGDNPSSLTGSTSVNGPGQYLSASFFAWPAKVHHCRTMATSAAMSGNVFDWLRPLISKTRSAASWSRASQPKA